MEAHRGPVNKGPIGPSVDLWAQKSTRGLDLPAAATKSDPHRRGFGASVGLGGSCGSIVGPKTLFRPQEMLTAGHRH